MRLVAECSDVSADAAGFRRDHRVDFSVEKFLVKLLRFRDVLASDFKMHNGSSHGNLLRQKGLGSEAFSEPS